MRTQKPFCSPCASNLPGATRWQTKEWTMVDSIRGVLNTILMQEQRQQCKAQG